MDILLDKHKVSSLLLNRLVNNLTNNNPEKCLIFEPIPIVPKDFNDGCEDGLRVGNHGYYLTSAVKQKRALLSQLPNHDVVICEGRYVRASEIVDKTHLPYLTQYDWECKIEDRSIETLTKYVDAVWKSIREVANSMSVKIPKKVHYVTSQHLQETYPSLIPDERVAKYMYDNNYKTIFVIGIGEKLADGNPHDTRANDYDDHTMNGDLFVLHDKLLSPLELMSCGIRVDASALERQLGTNETKSKYHQNIFDGKYVQCVGGGLGKERTLMYLFNLEDISNTYHKLDN